MSSTVTVRPTKGVRGIGLFTIIAGIVLIVAGIVVWIVVSMTLSAEEITVSDDANMFAGQHVAGPFTAYAQASVIEMHATEMADGKTYAELPQDDPMRDTVMDASFLRASLFTSVVAFGVCALVIGIGLMFLFLGVALRKLAGGPEIAIAHDGLSSGGDMSAAAPASAATAAAAAPVGAHARPAEPAPVESAAPAAPVESVAPAAPVEPAAPTEPAAPERTSAIRPVEEEPVAETPRGEDLDAGAPGGLAGESTEAPTGESTETPTETPTEEGDTPRA